MSASSLISLSRRLAWTTALVLAIAAPLSAETQPAKPRTIGEPTKDLPGPIPGGFNLPNGWRITPAGTKIADTGDLILNMIASPDGKVLVASHSGYQPHGLTVIDAATRKVVQDIPLKSAWLGLSWSADGKTLYASGGNANGDKDPPSLAPIYAIPYEAGRLAPDRMARFEETLPLDKIFWAGVARHPTKPRLYAANRGVDDSNTNVVVFDTTTRQVVARIPVGVSPYDVVLSRDGARLFVSNWSSRNVSVIDTASNAVVATIPVGANPNDMALSADGRLFVACSNDNTVHVIDTKTLKVIETISSTLTPRAPEGSTPNALEIDAARKLLFVANADNNSVAVVDIGKREHSAVAGFIPTGWYPSALTLTEKGAALYVGSSKGQAAYPDIMGPGSPLRQRGARSASIKDLQTASIERITMGDLLAKLPAYSRQVYANTPYNDSLLDRARPAKVASVIPSEVGVGSPIKHIIYIIKENRTYDQVLGDLPGTNGDPRLAIFGGKITPNHHALAQQFVALDNIYCDGEVSEDGHSWTNAAYATDFNEKSWPANYGGHSTSGWAPAKVPSTGYLWDLAKRYNLTYRSYGEFANRVSTGAKMEPRAGIFGLQGHMSDSFGGWEARDTANAESFIKEMDGFDARFDSSNPADRLPNVSVMILPEDHTKGSRPGEFTPQAAVASNDYGLGLVVDRVSHSRYWAQTAIFVIEDDAQDGSDHVDARRTVAFAISPYIHRKTVDSTLYTTSSLLRSIELLLGLPPMSQYDAAATPLYVSFSDKPDLTPYVALKPQIDLNTKNTVTAYGAAESAKMDFTEEDRAPMHRLNEIVWKVVMGVDSVMPPPVHRYRPLIDSTPASVRR